MPSINQEILRLTNGLEDAADMVMSTVPGSPAREEALKIYKAGAKEAQEILAGLDPDWRDPLAGRLYAEDLGRRMRESKR